MVSGSIKYMCIITKTQPELLTATEDIRVYKYIRKIKKSWCLFHEYKYISYVKGFRYKKGKTYTTLLGEFRVILPDPHIISSYCSSTGFYSWPTSEGANAVFVIPKGAKYYKCLDCYEKEIVFISDKIKFVEYYE